MSISPNLKVGNDWRGSLNVAFATLRRILFIQESDFSFGDFDPQVNWNGMAASNVSILRARYLKIFNMLWFSLDLSATLAATFTTSFSIIMPATAGSVGLQSFAGIGQNGGSNEGCVAEIQAGTNILNIYRIGFGNYSAGSTRQRINGFMETL